VNPVAANVQIAIFYTAQIVTLMIIIRAFMTFFPRVDRHHPVVRFLDSVVDPILTPFQRMMPPMAGLDLSPILAILTIRIGSELLMSLVGGLMGGVG